MANKKKNNNIVNSETNITEDFSLNEELNNVNDNVIEETSAVESDGTIDADETAENIEETIIENKSESTLNVDNSIIDNATSKQNVKQSFKNIFKYKNGKPVKYVEDNGFKEEMKNIAKKRGYYEDIFKTNPF